MQSGGYVWRARVLLVLSLAVGAWFGPSAVLGFLAGGDWEVPDPAGYEVVTRATDTGALVARRAATWWDVAFHFVVGPVIVVLLFVGLSALGTVYSYRMLRRYESQVDTANRFFLLALGVMSLLGLVRVAQVAFAARPSLAAWIAWSMAMALAAILVRLGYGKLRSRLIG